MADKKSFILYTDTLAVLEKLTDEQCGKLLRMMHAYHVGETDKFEALQQDALLNIVFTPFELQFARDKQKYDEKVERRREAGRLGGIKKHENQQVLANASKCYQKVAKGSKSKQNLANLADNVNDNDNDNVNVSVNDNSLNNLCEKARARVKKTGIVITDAEPMQEAGGYKVEELAEQVRQHASSWIETWCMNNHVSLQEYNELVNAFVVTLQNYGETHKTLDDFKHHFAAWYNKNKKNNGNSNKQTIQQRRAADKQARNAERMARIINLAKEA